MMPSLGSIGKLRCEGDYGSNIHAMGICSLMAEFVTDWNTMMAFTVLASVPLVVAFVFLQRYMVQGMTGGALTS